MKNSHLDPNSYLLPETAAGFEVVDWNFGYMIHMPSMKHLGHPNGRVNLKDLKPDYAGKLVDAGFRHLKRKHRGRPAELMFQPVAPAPETAPETVETVETTETTPVKRGKKKS